MSRPFDWIVANNTGVTVTTTASTSTGGTLPTNADGTRRFIRVATTARVHVRFGIGAQTAVTTDLMIPAGDAVIIPAQANTHYAVIDGGSTATVNLVALENS